MANPRVLKLADQIKVIVADMLERRIKDPRLGFVTVTEVRLTGDSREATVFYTVLGTPEETAASAVALASAAGVIRTQVGRQLGLRYTPSLAFVRDALPESAQALEEVLRKAKDVDVAVAQVAVGAVYAGDEDPYRHRDEASGDDADLDDMGVDVDPDSIPATDFGDTRLDG